VIATVSRAQGATGLFTGTSSTYVLEDSPVVKVGGDRTTDEVWDIRVFHNSNPTNALTSQSTILVKLSSSSCTAVSWKKIAMNFTET
jgi:hypothetical protein